MKQEEPSRGHQCTWPTHGESTDKQVIQRVFSWPPMNLADTRGTGQTWEMLMLLAISNRYKQYTNKRQSIRKYGDEYGLDRDKQIMQLNLEKDTIMMQRLYRFCYSHKVINRFKFPVRRNDMCSETVLRSGYVYDRKQCLWESHKMWWRVCKEMSNGY